MGAYLSEPNTNKESIDEDNEHLSYGASSMQGWRIDQEDAHNSILNFDEATRTSLFAVYDGHGGSEVAEYCAKYLPEFLKKLEEYQSGNLEEALKKVFLKFDESLLSAEAQKELKELREVNSRKTSIKGEEEEEDKVDNETENNKDEEQVGEEQDEPKYESEEAALYDEATMPLEEVLKRYTRTENKIKKALKKKGLSKKEETANPSNFQEQEEKDINEIKKNSLKSPDSSNSNNSNNQHENDYDEASNLGEISESQKSNCESSNLQVSDSGSKLNITENGSSSSASTSNQSKLNKEEIKLSPIRKKSLSSSLLIDDISSIQSTSETTVLNGTISEDNKENDNSNPNCNSKKLDTETETDLAENTTTTTVSKNAKSKKISNTNLIAKFIAGVVNSRIKQGLKNNKKSKKENQEEKKQEQKEDNDQEEEEEDDDEDNDDDDEEENENEDGEDEEDEYEEEEDEEDDEEEEDDDYEEEEDEDEEEIDIDSSQGMGLDSRPGYDSGCTAVVALLRDNKQLFVANAGDSRCVVCRDGKAIDMSFDHKPEDESERERIEKAGGIVTKDGRVNAGLNLSRAIGDHSYKQNKELSLSEQMITSLPDLKVLDIDLATDKFMVLACDGIWNFMTSQEVCDYVQERLNSNYSKLSQICEELFMHCLAPDSEGDGTGCDNMTCIIVTFYPFRKITLTLSKADLIEENDKISLKRSHEQEDKLKLDQTNQSITKKLRQEEEIHKTENGQ